jgi:hypothetical protein
MFIPALYVIQTAKYEQLYTRILKKKARKLTVGAFQPDATKDLAAFVFLMSEETACVQWAAFVQLQRTAHSAAF